MFWNGCVCFRVGVHRVQWCVKIFGRVCSGGVMGV